MTRHPARFRLIASVLAVALMIAVAPTLALAQPVQPATLTLPTNWVKAYETPTSVDAWSPCADGTNVAWIESDRDGAHRIVLFDSVTKTTKSWPVDSSAGRLSMSGTRIAFRQSVGEEVASLAILDTVTGRFTEVAGLGNGWLDDPFLSGTKLVYSSYKDFWDIYVYDLLTEETTLLAGGGPGDFYEPAIYGDRVVFVRWMPNIQGTSVTPQVKQTGTPLDFPTGYSVGYVPLAGGTAYPLSYASDNDPSAPVIWGSRAYWLQGPELSAQPAIQEPSSAQMYDFGSSSRSTLPLSPAPNTNGFLKVRGDWAAWSSGAWAGSRSVSDGRGNPPTKPQVSGKGQVGSISRRTDGQLNVRNMATGQQSVFMTGTSFFGCALGAGLVTWGYEDVQNETGRVIVAQYVQPAPPAPVLSLGDPNVAWKVRRNRYFEIFGALSPVHKTGAKSVQLSFERWVGKRYRYQQTSMATSYATGSSSQHYGLLVKLKRSGRWRVRAFHPADADGPDTWSGYHSFLVR